MRIGILTFHKSINYGAVAQCYALVKRIQADFPNHEVEVIDYVPQFRLDKYNVSLARFLFGSISSKNNILLNLKIFISKLRELILHPDNYRLLKIRKVAFANSMEILPLSKEQYRQNNVADFCASLNRKYDVIVVGSDCVWEWSTVPFPNAYYLVGEYGAKKMSYAASVGTDDFGSLHPEIQKQLKDALNDFFYIGVRDSSTEYVVNSALENKRVYHNCDPTTLLDMGSMVKYKDKVKRRLLEKGVDFSKPIIGIMGNEKLSQLARDIFGDNCSYIAVYVPNHLCDVNMLELTVPEWMAIFGLFDLTLTTFFHGTMLSLVNSVPVLSFDYLPETKEQITKLHELYNRLELPGFYHRGKRVYTQEDAAIIGKIAKEFIENPPTHQIEREIKRESQYYETFNDSLKKIINN